MAEEMATPLAAAVPRNRRRLRTGQLHGVGSFRRRHTTLSRLLLTHRADGVREKAEPNLAGVASNVAASASGSLPVLHLLIFLIGSLCVFPKNPEGGDESRGTIYARQMVHNQAPGTTRHDLNYIARG